MPHIVQDAHRTFRYYIDTFAALGYMLFASCVLFMQPWLVSFDTQEFFLVLNNAMWHLLLNPVFIGFSVFYLLLWLVIRWRFRLIFIELCHADDEFSTALSSETISSSNNSTQALDVSLEVNHQDIHFDQMIRAGALLDRETAIGNRMFFNNRLEALIKEDDVHGAVIFIQFSEYEQIEALYKHSQSLELLSLYIDIIKQRLSKISGHVIARRSNNEIALLLPRMRVPEIKAIVIRLLKNLLSAPTLIEVNAGEFIHLGVSYFNQERSAYRIKSQADMALRTAQLQGPSQWFMYDIDDLEFEEVKGSLRWRTYLLKMINKNSFVIFFQPVLSRKSNDILHHEVLCKVKEDSGKYLSARVFIPMAQKCGLTHEIDLLITQNLCRTINYEKNLHDQFSLNIAIESLLSEDFMRKFFKMLKGFSNIANRLFIEISEYHLSQHIPEIESLSDKLHAAGVRLLVDKVGQYVVKASYLKRCRVSAMKLHRSIVLDIHKKPENQIFIQSIINLTYAHNISIFALGVESEKEWEILKSLGVDGGQGYYFSEPVAYPFMHQPMLTSNVN